MPTAHRQLPACNSKVRPGSGPPIHPCVIHSYIAKLQGLEIKTNDGLKGVIVYLKNRNDKTTTVTKLYHTDHVTSIHVMAFLLGINIAVCLDTEMFQQDQER